jgi:ABC-type nitrate/sulfonate/bicarbonate transport system permease component
MASGDPRRAAADDAAPDRNAAAVDGAGLGVSDRGRGDRIFLVRRYLAMDIILPYVAWISLLAIAADALLQWISRRAFPWAGGGAR